ncbi:YrdB family protein [Paeniglutamicibacter antarcticus]|uniref:YrdB family protein n=1 Tax=Arthrobacter terrae TaxID=2935737 RepID=A0A931GCA7_9MICC|nr:YrdB family protein [Arthrobacter terrae]MBG0741552.1 YrdB family protein [Arthrobacter terrae]
MSRRRAASPPAFLTGVNLSVSFLLEVVMVAAFSFWGFKVPPPWNIIVGISLPVAVVVVWSLLLAPRALYRIPLPLVAPAALLIFLLAALALADAGLQTPAVVLAVVSAVNAGLGLSIQRRAPEFRST